MSTRVLSDTLLKSSRIRAQQAILSLSLNISLICFASSHSYVPSRTCKNWRHVITRSFPVNNYVCLYKFEHETIYIAHIFHQSQDYARLV